MGPGGADRIPDLQVYGPPPMARMTDQLFGVDVSTALISALGSSIEAASMCSRHAAARRRASARRRG
jgi:hypothetical protein